MEGGEEECDGEEGEKIVMMRRGRRALKSSFTVLGEGEREGGREGARGIT